MYLRQFSIFLWDPFYCYHIYVFTFPRAYFSVISPLNFCMHFTSLPTKDVVISFLNKSQVSNYVVFSWSHCFQTLAPHFECTHQILCTNHLLFTYTPQVFQPLKTIFTETKYKNLQQCSTVVILCFPEDVLLRLIQVGNESQNKQVLTYNFEHGDGVLPNTALHFMFLFWINRKYFVQHVTMFIRKVMHKVIRCDPHYIWSLNLCSWTTYKDTVQWAL